MGANNHIPYVETTHYRPSEMNPPLSQLDRAITYQKSPLVSCDGDVSYNTSTGVLTWSGTIRILFIREDGQTILNTIAAGSKTLAVGQMGYVTLNETTATALTIAAADVNAGVASNFLAYNILVLVFRNAASGKLVLINWAPGEEVVGIQPFDIHAFHPSTPPAGAYILFSPLARPVTFPANFVGSFGKVGTAATGSSAFDIKKNGVSVGTMTFAPAATSATFVSTGGAPVVFAAGDILMVTAPSTPDATLADVGLALTGYR